MSILVTGATGFIGTNLVRRLTARGESVRILRREWSNRLGLEGLPLEEHIGDVRDYDTVRQAVRGCKQVYHLAALLKLAPFERDRFQRTNVLGSENLARAALEEGIEKMVYTSSIAAIGWGTEQQPATEETTFNLGRFRLPYIDTKRAGEEVVLEYGRKGLPVVVVNPGYVFGPWDKRPGLNRLLILAAQKKLWFYIGGGLSVVDVADVVQGQILAMEKGQAGQRYILSNQNLTYKEFMSMANEFLGQKPPRFRIPFWVMFSAGLMAEGLGKLFRFNPQISARLARMSRLTHYVSSEKAKRELGYATTPLAESFKKTFEWLREYHFIKERK
ncbi:MAG: SDR family oxidoreductase [bacterium]